MGYWGGWEGVLHASGWITDGSNPNSQHLATLLDTTPTCGATTGAGADYYQFYQNGTNITMRAAATTLSATSNSAATTAATSCPRAMSLKSSSSTASSPPPTSTTSGAT